MLEKHFLYILFIFWNEYINSLNSIFALKFNISDVTCVWSAFFSLRSCGNYIYLHIQLRQLYPSV